ncbi:MAG: riboflavin synthase [Bacteroidota bacterium]|nr:riboflavin synthase [Bacteroidota bacterium]
MFTGIIEETGIIRKIRTGAHSSQLTVGAGTIMVDMKIGDSINTQGVCLTVTGFAKDEFTMDVMAETLNRTSFRQLRTGSKVNLERALQLSGRLGGHLVTGHIDGTGKVTGVRKEDIATRITVSADKNILKYIVDKGSVALDGTSLTVARTDEHSFDVYLIPHTQLITTLDAIRQGDQINIECDIIAKYLEKLTSAGDKRIDLNFLAEHGF